MARRESDMRRRIMVLAALVSLFGAACGTDGNETVLRADDNREIVVNMDEFDFGADVIEVFAGETVTFVLLNNGVNEHEFMIGRDLVETEEGYPNGFVHDFFETVTPIVDPPSAGMDMGSMDMSGMDMSGMDMEGDDGHAEDEMDADMSGMDMGDEDMSGMDMEGDDGHAEDEMDADMSGMDMGDEDAHAGFMVQRRPGEVARLTVTVPDDVIGEWEIGCFRGRGAHWDAGMSARLVVLSA